MIKEAFAKYRKNITVISLIELAAIILSAISVYIFLFFEKKIENINLPDNIYNLPSEEILRYSELMPKYYYTLIMLIVFLFLALSIIWISSRSLLWKRTCGHRLETKFALKSIGIGYLWFIATVAIIVILFLTIRQPYDYFIAGLCIWLFGYLIDILMMEYSLNSKISLKKWRDAKTFAAFSIIWLIALVFTALVLFLVLMFISYINLIAYITILLMLSISLIIYFDISRFYLLELYKGAG